MREPLVAPAPPISRINVTPIIDVALVLVIILLITAPMITVSNMDISLPETRTRGAEEPLYVPVTVGRNGELALDDDRIGGSELQARLRDRILAAADREVLVAVRADAGVSHGAVRKIMREARAAGAKRLAVATRQGRNAP